MPVPEMSKVKLNYRAAPLELVSVLLKDTSAGWVLTPSHGFELWILPDYDAIVEKTQTDRHTHTHTHKQVVHNRES